MSTQIKNVLSAAGMNDSARVNFYNTVPSEATSPFDCDSETGTGHHGEPIKQDCQFNRYEVCAMKHVCPTDDLGTCDTASQLTFSKFVSCAEGEPYAKNGKLSFVDPPSCAKKFFTTDQVSAIEKCAGSTAGGSGDGAEAVTLLSGVTQMWSKDKPHFAMFPSIIIDGTRCVSCNGSGNLQSFIQVVCAAYKGSTKPAACASALELSPSSSMDDVTIISED